MLIESDKGLAHIIYNVFMPYQIPELGREIPFLRGLKKGGAMKKQWIVFLVFLFSFGVNALG